jgi:hypothetical protein
MKLEVMKARVGEFFMILDSRLWYDVVLDNGVKSRIALTIEEKIQGLGVREGSVIEVRTRPNDKRDDNFLVDFIKLIEP